jgi:uncharacterized membrane protein YqiK
MGDRPECVGPAAPPQGFAASLQAFPAATPKPGRLNHDGCAPGACGAAPSREKENTPMIAWQTMLHGVESYGWVLAIPLLIFAAIRWRLPLFGLVMIPQDSVGVVTLKYALRKHNRALPDGRIIALEGEAGVQADALAPGLYLWRYPWQYHVEVVRFVTVPPGRVGVVEARDGRPIPLGRVFARHVDSDSFQNARAFLTNGGERGPQVNVMTPGTYRINTALFDVEIVDAYQVPQNRIGIVTMSDGAQLDGGHIAGRVVEGHNGFQDGQAFIDAGGAKGLQEQVLMPGTYYLNPRLVSVALEDMFRVPIGYVGVVVSNVGNAPEALSEVGFKHGVLVGAGQRGVQKEPKDPGVYAINPRTHFIELVPTTNIVLNWAEDKSEAHRLDASLSPIAVRSKDGFSFNLDVSQIIHIARENASLVIAQFGSMTNLVTQVLEPIIGNYFRNSAQSSEVIDFIQRRQERQVDARDEIRKAVNSHGVEAVDTLIGDISPPAELMKTLTDQKVAEREIEMYAAQRDAEEARQNLERARALADSSQRVVTAGRDAEVAALEADAAVARARGQAGAKTIQAEADAQVTRVTGEAEAGRIRAVGEAEANVQKLKVESVGEDTYARMQIAVALADHNVRLVPDVLVGAGTGANGSGLVDAFLGLTLKEQLAGRTPRS